MVLASGASYEDALDRCEATFTTEALAQESPVALIDKPSPIGPGLAIIDCVNVVGVIYLIDSSWLSLFGFGSNSMTVGAYCSQVSRFC